MVALGVGHLVSAATGPATSPLVAVGGSAIDVTPSSVKEFAVAAFGDQDKLVLILGMSVVIAILAAAFGALTVRFRWLGPAGFAAFGAVGAISAATRPAAGALAAVPTVVGTVIAIAVLVVLVRHVPGPDGQHDATVDRRRFLYLAGGAFLLAGASGGGGLLLGRRTDARAARSAVALPRPVSRARPVPAGADLGIRGLGPFTTPNRDFYRVDTALSLPQVDPRDWALRIHGMVDRPIELSFAELLERPMLERDITLTCVSNQVGGKYVDNARWLGVDLAKLLRATGIRSGADQILSRSADGWTCGTPVETVLDGRDALLAVGMNGEPLPITHGFPARMVVPGLYGYASATKWVVDMKLTTFADEQAYWVKRDWAERAPIKTMSRIDVPRPLSKVRAGTTKIAGIAWAQRRGIDAVEVSVDGGAWRPAELAAVPSTDTWNQWSYDWDATPGQHTIRARATDATGYTQTPERVPPIPDGATGWQSIVVTVT